MTPATLGIPGLMELARYRARLLSEARLGDDDAEDPMVFWRPMIGLTGRSTGRVNSPYPFETSNCAHPQYDRAERGGSRRYAAARTAWDYPSRDGLGGGSLVRLWIAGCAVRFVRTGNSGLRLASACGSDREGIRKFEPDAQIVGLHRIHEGAAAIQDRARLGEITPRDGGNPFLCEVQ